MCCMLQILYTVSTAADISLCEEETETTKGYNPITSYYRLTIRLWIKTQPIETHVLTQIERTKATATNPEKLTEGT